MDYEENAGHEPNEQPFSPPGPAEIPARPGEIRQPPKKKSGWRIFWNIILVLSILVNIFLFIGLIGTAAILATGSGDFFATTDGYIEETIVEGDRSNKIVVIRIEGIIDGEMSKNVCKQIKSAKEDKKVKALILRTITPGGMVSSSDQIYHEIVKFRQDTGRPAVAFMQTVAASGGYYTSVACDRIVAEPTVITGSIGVILSHLVLKELLEEKLGIAPVVIKSGRKKDWPSIFSETTDEQKEYLAEKLIGPAFERFVGLVAEGRKGKLTEAEVRELADGSIFGAVEAQEKALIDEVGYIDEAIAATEKLAGIEDAQVVEYSRPFSLSMLLASQGKRKSGWEIDKNVLQKMGVPQLLYLWDAGW